MDAEGTSRAGVGSPLGPNKLGTMRALISSAPGRPSKGLFVDGDDLAGVRRAPRRGEVREINERGLRAGGDVVLRDAGVAELCRVAARGEERAHSVGRGERDVARRAIRAGDAHGAGDVGEARL